MRSIAKATSLAAIIALGMKLAAGAAEPPKADSPADLEKLVGQPVDMSPWAYAWRADREVQEKPEAYFIPRRLKRLDTVYRPVAMQAESRLTEEPRSKQDNRHVLGFLPAPKGGLHAALLWLAPVPTERIELRWPEGNAVPPAEAIEVRVYPAEVGWFGWVRDQVLPAPQVSPDGRTWSYINQLKDPATGKAVFDGRIEAYDCYVTSVKPLADDKGTTMTAADAWKSAPAAGGGRRGLVVSLLHPGLFGTGPRQHKPRISPLDARITLWTKGGNLTFVPEHVSAGPILVPEHGVFIAKAGSEKTGPAFAAELAAKNPRSVLEVVRRHKETASCEEVLRQIKLPGCKEGTEIGPVESFEEPPETAMRVQTPDERWNDAWQRASWQLHTQKGGWQGISFENAPMIHAADLIGSHDASAKRYEYWLSCPGTIKPDGDFVDGDGSFEYAKSMKDDIGPFLRFWMNNYAAFVQANGGMSEVHEFGRHQGNPQDKPNGDLGTTAWFMTQFRNLLVWEDADVLWLARATPRAWLEQGEKISVKNAPTFFGPTAYEIVSDVDNGKITATVEMPSRKAPKEVVLRFRHPKAAPIKGVAVNGKPWTEFDKDKETITLKGLTGTVAVTATY